MLDFEIKKLLEVKEENDQKFFLIDSIPARYTINRKGLIFDSKLKRDIYPYFKNGYLAVRLSLGEESVIFDVRKLLLMCFSPMHTSSQNYLHKLKAISLDSDLLNLDLNNLIWKVPFGGLECNRYPGYYSIPGNPSLVISRQGKVLDYLTGEERVAIPPLEGKTYSTVNSPQGFKVSELPFRTTLVHRLMALAFIPLEGIEGKFYVSFIDGNKENTGVSNLEWKMYGTEDTSEGTVKGVAFMAVDIYTKQRRQFSSLHAISRALGFHASDISRAISEYRQTGKIICPPWLFLEEGDVIPSSFLRIQKQVRPIGIRWFLVEKDGVSEYVSGTKNLCRYLETKNVVLQETRTFYNTFQVKGYTVKEVYRQDVPPEVYKKENETRGGKEQKVIRVTDLTSNAVTTYPSTDHFATLVGAERKTIQRGMNYNDGIWRNFKIEYIDKQ